MSIEGVDIRDVITIGAIVIALLSLVFGILRYLHSRRTARVPNLTLYHKEDSSYSYKERLSRSRPIRGAYTEFSENGKVIPVSLSKVGISLSADPVWSNVADRSEEVEFPLYIENLGSLVARSVKFIIHEEEPGIWIRIRGGQKVDFKVPGHDSLPLTYIDLGDLQPGISFDFKLSVQFASRNELRDIFSPSGKKLSHTLAFIIDYIIVSDDTPSQEKQMIIWCNSGEC